jgi:hypothetical protein
MDHICECKKPFMIKGSKVVCLAENCFCICEFSPIECRASYHSCSCTINPGKCLAEGHHCSCENDPEKCLSRSHNCACENNPEKCRNGNIYDHDRYRCKCICNKVSIDDKINKCKTNVHIYCICDVNTILCKGISRGNIVHRCQCFNGSRCKANEHDCLCEKTPWACKHRGYNHKCCCKIVDKSLCKHEHKKKKGLFCF